PVNVVIPGAVAIANAARAAIQLGNSDLASRLSDLSRALTNLVQDPTNAIYQSQALATLDSVITLLSADHFLSSIVSGSLTTARDELANAATAADVQSAVSDLGNALTSLAATITDEAQHGFTLGVAPTTAVALPGAPAFFNMVLTNTGSQPTTYDFSVSGLPADVTAAFSQTSVTLQPGQTITGGAGGITLSLTETGSSLLPTGFSV